MELRKSLRRKFSGNIRSPIVKRDNQAEVVIKGWLFKLEGATIKQWKKRWCILSEYCLFYYKGPEEEKCLGSILLPSYKIRQCIAEDKVSLKHSFVAEHQNTKTYYFAAENSSCMCQWMNAMSLAALMQTETPHSAGATGHRQRHHPPPHGFPPSYEPRPPLHQPPLRTSDESFEVEGYAVEHQYLGSGDQYPCSYTRSPIYDQRPGVVPGPRHPVYANAPPKPLRHGALSPTQGGYDGYNGYEAYDGYPGFEGYDGYDPQEQLPAYAGRPRSAHYGDSVAAVAMPALMRPHSADFLERDEEADVGEFRFGRVAASARPRPKSSMAQYDWEDEGYDEDEWRNCGGAVPVEKLVAGPQRGAAQDDPRRLLVGRRDDGGMQTKKAAHKEESMKRLLEWKQRMLQSPLRKKQGQQNLVPSSFELQSAVLKRPTQVLGGDVRAPPERPPLPEEYRRRVLDEVHAPGEVWTGQRRLSGGPLHEPIAGRPHEMQDAPGPDLIRKRCRSNDFAKPKTRDGMYRHSTDDLHSCNIGCHSLSPLQLDSEPTPPPSGGLSHSVSAGDLLGKSHEELVLLLIQLRRSQSSLLTCQMQCRAELQELKENIVQSEMKHSAADVQRLVSLQRSLNELTRNLGLTRPLISLVENMVKLGSLYNIAGIEKQNDRGVAEGTESSHEDVFVDNLETETLEKQQRMVEKEILRIQNMLAESTTFGSPLKEDLEVELKRLQKIVDNLLLRKGRTCPSPGLRLEEDRNTASTPEPRLSLACVPERKRHQKTYYETDLDSCVTSNLALSSRPSSLYNMSGSQMDGLESPSFSPEPSDRIEDDDNSCPTQDMNEADDRTKKFYGLLPRDRAQEIRTVRIVKRESERRHKGKDRRKGGASDDGALVWVVEQPETFFPHEQQTTESMSNLETSCPGGSYVSPYETKKEHGSASQEDRSTSSSSSDSLTGCRRAPGKNDSRRNKRRHYTISGSHPFLDQHSPSKMPACLRSRDDMDMERCLRTVNTPDIVRSTIKKSDVYDEQTIDMQIGLPEKILIPERYIEEESENVSAVEQLRRSLKAANIRKMLTETVGYEDLDARGSLEAVRSQVGEEKRRRAHLLALSHTIAKEVMERSKMVAVMATLERMDPEVLKEEALRRQREEQDSSPEQPLPLYQQRENLLT